jgi:hypothetical protein
LRLVSEDKSKICLQSAVTLEVYLPNDQVKESFPNIIEVSYLILGPLIFTLIIGFGILKLFNSKILNTMTNYMCPCSGSPFVWLFN